MLVMLRSRAFSRVRLKDPPKCVCVCVWGGGLTDRTHDQVSGVVAGMSPVPAELTRVWCATIGRERQGVRQRTLDK